MGKASRTNTRDHNPTRPTKHYFQRQLKLFNEATEEGKAEWAVMQRLTLTTKGTSDQDKALDSIACVICHKIISILESFDDMLDHGLCSRQFKTRKPCQSRQRAVFWALTKLSFEDEVVHTESSKQYSWPSGDRPAPNLPPAYNQLLATLYYLSASTSLVGTAPRKTNQPKNSKWEEGSLFTFFAHTQRLRQNTDSPRPKVSYSFQLTTCIESQ